MPYEVLCHELRQAADFLEPLQSVYLRRGPSGAKVAAFVRGCADKLEAGSALGTADLQELTLMFAPTTDWDDVEGDLQLGQRIYEQLTRLRGTH